MIDCQFIITTYKTSLLSSRKVTRKSVSNIISHCLHVSPNFSHLLLEETYRNLAREFIPSRIGRTRIHVIQTTDKKFVGHHINSTYYFWNRCLLVYRCELIYTFYEGWSCNNLILDLFWLAWTKLQRKSFPSAVWRLINFRICIFRVMPFDNMDPHLICIRYL